MGVRSPEQRPLAEALAASEARYRHLVENAPDIIYRTDTNGRFTFVNATAEAILGKPHSELIGHSYLELIHQDDRDAMRRHYGLQWVRRTPQTYAEFRVDTANGEYRWIGQNVQLLIEGDQPVGFQAIARDITDRKLAQEALERLQRQTESILNSAAEGIVSVDARGSIAVANPAAASITGYAVAEMLGQSAHALLHHSRPDGSPYPLAECSLLLQIERGSVTEHETDVFWKRDGTSFPVEYTIVPIIAQRRITGATLTFHDITERQLIERMKDQFIALVSHELRTPLTSMRASIGLLRGGLVDLQSEQGQRMLEVASSNTDRLIRLIGDILDLEQISRGRTILECSDVNIADVLERSRQNVQERASASGVEIVLLVESAWVTGDLSRLIQALTNVIDNAVKFSPSGESVHVQCRVRDGEVRIAVRDRGDGIPPDKLESIFERFVQVETSETRTKGGTGLGLTISRGLVELHGGRVWAESTPGEGTTFWLTLPMREPLPPRAPGVSPRRSVDASGRRSHSPRQP